MGVWKKVGVRAVMAAHRRRWRLKSLEGWAAVGSGSSPCKEGQGGLACCNPWGLKEPDTTERLDSQGVGIWQAGFHGLTSAYLGNVIFSGIYGGWVSERGGVWKDEAGTEKPAPNPRINCPFMSAVGGTFRAPVLLLACSPLSVYPTELAWPHWQVMV